MIHKKRKSRRIKVLENQNIPEMKISETISQEDERYGCLIRDISLDGVCLLINNDYEVEEEYYVVNIEAIEEIGFSGITVGVRKVWVDNQSGLYYRSVGCEFIKDSDEVDEKIKFLHKNLDRDDVQNTFILASLIKTNTT